MKCSILCFQIKNRFMGNVKKTAFGYVSFAVSNVSKGDYHKTNEMDKLFTTGSTIINIINAQSE